MAQMLTSKMVIKTLLERLLFSAGRKSDVHEALMVTFTSLEQWGVSFPEFVKFFLYNGFEVNRDDNSQVFKVYKGPGAPSYRIHTSRSDATYSIKEFDKEVEETRSRTEKQKKILMEKNVLVAPEEEENDGITMLGDDDEDSDWIAV